MDHCFSWTIILDAPRNAKTKKNLEASYCSKLDLNEQKDF